MTLDEWKAQRQAVIVTPQYNLRKAGEGEDNKWDNMRQLNKKSGTEGGEGSKKDGDGKGKDLGAKKKQVLDLEFHFNDGRRGGLGRRGPGNAGGGDRRDGDRRDGDRRDGNKQMRRPRPPPRENGEEGAPGPVASTIAAAVSSAPHPDAAAQRDRRQQRRPRFQRAGDPEGQHAPKVDDERDFPSLG